MHYRRLSLVIVLAAAAAGCATVTTGTTQTITVDSAPPGADCTLTRSGMLLATVTTPAPVTLKRDSKPIHVVCRKDGYEDGKVVANPVYESAAGGNILVGSIGTAIDASSGASSRYLATVTVPLTPAVAGPPPSR